MAGQGAPRDRLLRSLWSQHACSRPRSLPHRTTLQSGQTEGTMGKGGGGGGGGWGWGNERGRGVSSSLPFKELHYSRLSSTSAMRPRGVLTASISGMVLNSLLSIPRAAICRTVRPYSASHIAGLGVINFPSSLRSVKPTPIAARQERGERREAPAGLRSEQDPWSGGISIPFYPWPLLGHGAALVNAG